MTVSQAVSLSRLTDGDVAAAVQLHRSSFPGFFLSQLGPRFLPVFYRGFVDAPDAVTVNVRAPASGDLQAVAVGTTQPAGLYRRLVKRQTLSFTVAAASSIARRPWILPRLVRALRHRGVPVPVSGALLSSICVSAAAQGAGVGSAVLVEWLRGVAAAGVDAAYLTTDAVGNEHVNRLCSRHGWRLAGTFMTAEGRAMNCYRIDGSPT